MRVQCNFACMSVSSQSYLNVIEKIIIGDMLTLIGTEQIQGMSPQHFWGRGHFFYLLEWLYLSSHLQVCLSFCLFISLAVEVFVYPSVSNIVCGYPGEIFPFIPSINSLGYLVMLTWWVIQPEVRKCSRLEKKLKMLALHMDTGMQITCTQNPNWFT